ncbi:outer membrane lipoprotein carrier protein LolA [Reyranella sp. CPCC 100927]|uniref:LolA family protein n=1 Tax=Reyranella sp. CPCC 100927 TaxID=2599616 RepID=UPI0011B71A5D|nr:outer membrane lipoprotein carrier protein LolA [Reyranella sp. CPCC 100927]TWS99604.1 outer membrane lipoprotein carrier protein LolA [Reyranella sp. CPCC 100927]
MNRPLLSFHRVGLGFGALAVALSAWLLTPTLGNGAAALRVAEAQAQNQPGTQTPRRQPRRKVEETPPPVVPVDQQAEVQRIEQYLNSVQTLQARFTQTSSNGNVAPGTLSLQRPGRMRFEYDPPSKILIVADGSQITIADFKDRSMSQWPIGWTSASFLAAKEVKLSGDLTVTGVTRNGTDLHVAVVQTKRPQEGKVELVFADQPLLLKGWVVWDAKNVPVAVTLSNVQTGVTLSRDLFRFDESMLKRDRFQ